MSYQDDSRDYAARVEDWRHWRQSSPAKDPVDAQAKKDAQTGAGKEWATPVEGRTNDAAWSKK